MCEMDGNTNEENEAPAAKKVKRNSECEKLSLFQFKRVISNNQDSKTAVIEGTIKGDENPALIILEKETFQEDRLRNIFQEEHEIEKKFQNDIYHSYRYSPSAVLNGIKTTLIYPATEKHIRKYEYQPVHLIKETPQLYETVTLPFLKSEQFSLQWVLNILEHRSEADRIVFEDSDPEIGFILLSDLKWDGNTIETLYLLALPFKKEIMSLRDLTQKHLPLLRNIYNKGVKAIADKYSIPSSRLRVYIHYQPSFYHFHVHFTYLQYSPPGCGTEKAHLLSTVINNLELVPNYYQVSTLDFPVRESDNLFLKYESVGLVKKLQKKD